MSHNQSRLIEKGLADQISVRKGTHCILIHSKLTFEETIIKSMMPGFGTQTIKDGTI